MIKSHQTRWLRPIWTLLFCVLLTTEYSSVSALSGTYSPDSNWIAIDTNFPPTYSADHPDQVDQFFYVRGLIDEKMNLTDEIIADIKGKGISMFHVKFQIWRNAHRCAKYVSVTPDQITNFEDGKWFTIDRIYTEKEFLDFQIWLAANRDCEASVMAIKDLTLSYNQFVNITAPVIPEEKFREFKVPPAKLVLSSDKTPSDQHLLWDCDKTECTFEIALASTDNLDITFWSLKKATISFTGTTKTETSTNEVKTVALEKGTDLKTTDLTIKVKSDEPSVAIVQIGPASPPSKLYDEVKETGNWLKVDSWDRVKAFLEDKDLKDKSVQLLPQYAESASLKLIEDPVADMSKGCYKISYFFEPTANHNKFTISVDSHTKSADKEFVQRYDLFDFIPTLGSVESLEFCLADFIYDLKKVFTGTTQLYLKTDAPKNTNDANSKMTFVYAEKLKATKNADAPIHFIKGDEPKKWTNIQPGLLAAIPSLQTKAPIKIDASTTQTQSKTLSSVWLVNDPALYKAPIELSLKLNTKFEDLSKEFAFKVQICDETMLCVDATENIKERKIEAEGTGSKVTYSFDLDASGESQHVKLQIKVVLPKDVNAEIDLLNFGDACYKPKCPEHSTCKPQDSKTNRANNEDACECEKGKWIDKHCSITDHCNVPTTITNCPNPKAKCVNTFDNSGHECQCDSSTKLQIWNIPPPSTPPVPPSCQEVKFDFKEVSPKKSYSWTADLSKVNPKIYDVCVKLKPASLDTKSIPVLLSIAFENNVPAGSSDNSISWTDSYRLITKKNFESVHLCLSRLFDTYVPTGAKLTITVDVDGAEHAFVAGDITLIAKDPKSALVETNHPKFDLTSAFIGDAHITVGSTPNADKVQLFDLREELPENGHVTLFSDWLPNHADQLTPEKINKNVLSIVETTNSISFLRVTMQLCRPQIAGSLRDNCLTVANANNLAEALKSLQLNEKYQKIQIVLNFEAIQAVKPAQVKAEKIGLQVSLWDGCTVQGPACDHNSVCKSSSWLYQCVESGKNTCPSGFTGINCEIVISDSCNKDAIAQCAAQHGTCVPLPDKQFVCNCAPGYVWESNSQVCEKVGVEHVETKCNPGTEGCFINGLTAAPFSYLPKNFPIIEKSTSSRKLFYTSNSDSKLTIEVDNSGEQLDPAENDVCLHIKYFVAQNYKLAVRFEDSIHLFTIDDVATIEAKANTAISLSESLVCLKALLPNDRLTSLKKFKFEFITQSTTPNGAVVLELVPVDALNLLHLRTSLMLPDAPLKYIGRSTEEQANVTEAVVKHGLTYQWPAYFPDTINNHQWTPIKNAFQFKGREHGTIENVFFESAWIDHPMGSHYVGQLAVYLNFKVDLPIEYSSKDHFKMNIVLLDEQRKMIQSVTEVSAEEVKPPASNGAKRKQGEFIIRLDKGIELDKIFKVQFQIRFHDLKNYGSKAAINPLFQITDISLGDPCITIEDATAPNPLMVPRVCYGVSKYEIVPDPKSKCQRILEPQYGLIDFKCNCPKDSGLSGKDCRNANYCLFKHKFDVMNPDNALQRFSHTASGNEFCTGKNQKNPQSKCIQGRYEKFNFLCDCPDYTKHFDFVKQECVPIDPCILNPCKFESEQCTKNETANEFQRVCTCRPGYELKDGSCQLMPVKEEEKCDVKTECSSADLNMQCLRGVNGQANCKCPKGFKYTPPSPTGDASCKSEMCNFKGLHRCAQGCRNLDKEPFFECTCGENYELQTTTDPADKDVELYECVPKANAPASCKEWIGKYKTCVGGVRGCVEGFELNASGDGCVPKATHKMPACPNPLGYKFDDVTKEYVCDCANATRSYFVEDTKIKSTCTLSVSICDAGQPGREVCSKRGAGCLVDPNDINNYYCTCNVGKMFPGNPPKRVVPSKEVTTKSSAICLDVCELPYRKSQCAAIGAVCNSMKLWEKFKQTPALKTSDFCDCVPGTFLDETGFCVQEREALTFDLTFRWSHLMQYSYEEIAKMLANMHQDSFADTDTGHLVYVDPVGLANAELRAMALNAKEDDGVERLWGGAIKRKLLYDQAEKMLYNFKMIDTASSMDRTGRQDLQILEMSVKQIEELDNYVLKVAVKIPQEIKDKLTKEQQQYSLVLSDGVEADAETTTVAAAVTTAEPSTRAPIDDTLPPYDLSVYEAIAKNCHDLKNKENCIIPYMLLVLAGKTGVKPELHKPCTHRDACHGMSNCYPQNRSQFSCECDSAYFALESRATFKTVDPLIVYKNERCKSKPLCSQKCSLADDSNRHCIEKDPTQNPNTFAWTKDVECGCALRTALSTNSAGKKVCTNVCTIANCVTGNSECIPSDSSATCKCKSDFYGDRCEHQHSSNTWWIVGIVVLGVLALAAIGAAIFFWRSSSTSTTSAPRSSSSTPATSSKLSPVTEQHRQAANIRRISAKANLENVEQTTPHFTVQQHDTPENGQLNSQHIVALSTNGPQEVQQVELFNQKAAAVLGLSLESGQTRQARQTRVEQITEEEAQGQHSPSQKSVRSTDDTISTSGFKSYPQTARSSFASADVTSLDFSRQTSVNSLTVHEPFTPFNASPRTLHSRRSIATIAPTIEETNEVGLIKEERRHSNKSLYSSQSSASSHQNESSTNQEPNGPPEPSEGPGEVKFTAPLLSELSTTSSSSSSDTDHPAPVLDPPEPCRLRLPDPVAPQPSPAASFSMTSPTNLLIDSQEMSHDKFQTVRAKIAAILKLNTARSYKLSQPNSPESQRR